MKRDIELQLIRIGYQLRTAEVHDIEAIQNLVARRCNPFVVRQISESDLFRCITFGFLFVLLDGNGEIAAFHATHAFGDVERSAVVLFVCVDSSHNGSNLAVTLGRYSSLTALERGMRIKRTWVHPANMATLINHLNYEGYICDGFHPSLFMKDQVRMTISLLLTPATIMNNRIDTQGASHFLASHSEGRHYLCIPTDDFAALADLYRHTSHKIVAILPPNDLHGSARYLALPSERLGMNSVRNTER